MELDQLVRMPKELFARVMASFEGNEVRLERVKVLAPESPPQQFADKKLLDQVQSCQLHPSSALCPATAHFHLFEC